MLPPSAREPDRNGHPRPDSLHLPDLAPFENAAHRIEVNDWLTPDDRQSWWCLTFRSPFTLTILF
jgi:hypothetical protein